MKTLVSCTLLVVLVLCLIPSTHAQDPDPDVVEWLNTHAIPLATTEPGNGYEDLMPLKDLIGDARIVGLGEATHGTHEFFTMKHRMVEFLVQEMGFTIFAMESNYPETELLNRYVHTGEGNPAKLMQDMYWVWQTEEVLDLVDWMRAYNQTVDEAHQVSFVGIDGRYPILASQNVMAYLHDVDPEAAERAAEHYTCLETYALGTNEGITAYGELPNSETQGCGDSVRAVYDDMAISENRYTAASSTDAYTIALHNALTVVQSEEIAGKRIMNSGQHPRDRFMADNVTWMLDYYGTGTKMIIWAHNSHITAPIDTNLGGYLDQNYGDEYLTFGTEFDHGSFTASAYLTPDNPYGEFTTFELEPASEDFYSYYLRSANIPQFILDMRDLDLNETGTRWLRNTSYVHWIGFAYNPEAPEQFYAPASLTTMYDFLIFIEESTPSMLLPRESE
jgi:erythromycin esterase